MANEYPTMLTLAKLGGNDVVTGLIEANLDIYPELEVAPARTIQGTSFYTLTRTKWPEAQFTLPNEGAEVSTSHYERQLVETFHFEGQLEIAESILDAAADGLDPLTLDSSGVMKTTMQALARQFYYGTSQDAKGFQGLQEFVDDGMVVDRGGDATDSGSSVYGIRFGQQGVRFLFGGGSVMTMGGWMKQKVVRTVNSVERSLMALVNSLKGWVGLEFGHPQSVGRIKNITSNAAESATDGATELNDDVIAELLEKFPVGYRPDALMMTPRSLHQLRRSRNALGHVGAGAGGGPAVASLPDSAYGIPIYETNSLLDTEAID